MFGPIDNKAPNHSTYPEVHRPYEVVANVNVAPRRRVERPHEPQVQHASGAVRPQHHVAAVQIAVHKPVLVKMSQRSSDTSQKSAQHALIRLQGRGQHRIAAENRFD